jgi:hypothetical protein
MSTSNSALGVSKPDASINFDHLKNFINMMTYEMTDAELTTIETHMKVLATLVKEKRKKVSPKAETADVKRLRTLSSPAVVALQQKLEGKLNTTMIANI